MTSISPRTVSPPTASRRGETWLLVQHQFDGHHYTYLENIVLGALERGIRVVVGTGVDAHATRIREGLLARFGDGRLRFVSVPGPEAAPPRQGLVPLIWGELRRRRFVRRVFREASRTSSISHVFLPYLDACLFAVAALGSPFGRTPYSGITMRQRFHMRAMGISETVGAVNAAKGWLFRALLRQPTFVRMFTNDETLAEYFASRAEAPVGKVVHIPDPSNVLPTMPRAEARAKLGLPDSACVVLIYGFLDGRKGMPRLLSWLADARAAHAEVVVLAVGQQAPEVEALFAGEAANAAMSAGAIRTVKGFVPEADEPLYFGACDLVWLGYEQFEMMSGVLVKAAQHRRPVVFHDFGLIAHYAMKHGVEYAPGLPCSPALAHLPAGMRVRAFPPGAPVPDHSWTNAGDLIFG